jgi:hypothetical protein
MGYNAMAYATTAVSNIALGFQALEGTPTAPVTGVNNIALGYDSIIYATTGTNNTAIGTSAMAGVSATPLTGNYNTAVGDSALTAIQGAAATNTALGYDTGPTLTTGTGNILIGSGADVPTATTSDFLNIGNLIFATGMTGTLSAPAGYVGIGTTAPTGTLDVEGGTAAASTNGANIVLKAQNAGSGTQNGGSIILNPGMSTTAAPGGVQINNAGPHDPAGPPLLDVESGWEVSTGLKVKVYASNVVKFIAQGDGPVYPQLSFPNGSLGGYTYGASMSLDDDTGGLNGSSLISWAGSNGTNPMVGFVSTRRGTGTIAPIVFGIDRGDGAWNEKMRITTTGNVVIGAGEATGSTTGNILRGPNGSGTNIAGGNLTIQGGLATGNAATGDIIFSGAPPVSSGITAQTAATYMTIKGGGSTAGSVGIGTTTPAGTLDVEGGTAAASTNGENIVLTAQKGGTGNTNGGNILLNIGSASGTGAAGSVQLNGPANGPAFSTTSDARIKTNITPLENGLAGIAALEGVTYNYRPPAEREIGKDLVLPLGKRQIGVIAQNVEQVFPEAVETMQPSGVKTVNYNVLVAPLIEAVKTLKRRTDALWAAVALLYLGLAALFVLHLRQTRHSERSS